jgi:ubiquinone/menaquinone biosynthesis C-methylase UbiE
MATATDRAARGQPKSNFDHWEGEHVAKALARRSADEDARFVLNFLEPGMNLLDCGCGPGSITLGLATRVAPGEIVGIDINPKLLEQAKTAAAEEGVTNVRFEVGDVQALSLEDSRFDIVFSHALMEHLPKPMEGLAEMKRVLKPGGLIAIRLPDWGGNMLYPDANNLHRRFLDLQVKIFAHSGSDPYRGRRIGAMLEEQGFVNVRLTASYSSHGTPEQVAWMAQVVHNYLLDESRTAVILENGWATQEEIDQIKADFNAWAEMPGALHTRAWIEAVARKP